MNIFSKLIFTGAILAVAAITLAQPPTKSGDEISDGGDASGFITRIMKFDANKDGQLTRAEVIDARVLPLFDRADDNQDGIVTTQELTNLYGKESDLGPRVGPGEFGGPGGRGGPGRGGPGMGGPGMGGPGMGGPSAVGQVLPMPVREMLRLSGDQRKKVDALQKLVETNLDEILTEKQKQQLKEMKRRGPGGPDGDRGRSGPPDGPNGQRNGPPGENGRQQRPPQ